MINFKAFDFKNLMTWIGITKFCVMYVIFRHYPFVLPR